MVYNETFVASFGFIFFFSSRRRHTRFKCDWSSDVCSSDLLAIYLGAGKSLAEHNVFLGITYYDLFRTSLTIFGILGVLMLVAMVFPAWLRDGVHWLAGRLERRSRGIAGRIEQLRARIHRAHQCMVAFGSPPGWLALFWAGPLSGPAHANKLLAGYLAPPPPAPPPH